MTPPFQVKREAERMKKEAIVMGAKALKSMLELVLVVCLRHCNNVLPCNMALKVTFSISKTKSKTETKTLCFKNKANFFTKHPFILAS